MNRHLLVALSFMALLGGCGKPAGPPLSTQEQHIRQIVDNSGGNWDSLSQADRDMLVTQLGRGNLTTAKMSFSMRWSSEQARKGGKPNPGPGMPR